MKCLLTIGFQSCAFPVYYLPIRFSRLQTTPLAVTPEALANDPEGFQAFECISVNLMKQGNDSGEGFSKTA